MGRAAPCSCLALLLVGVTWPPHIAASAGGLLHHLFTLAGVTPALCLCGPIRQVTPPRVLPGTMLYGVRTFLDLGNRPRSPD